MANLASSVNKATMRIMYLLLMYLLFDAL